MTVDFGLGYAGDDYSWASPKGDTLAFVVAGNWTDGFIMKSFDNGNTWTKTLFYNNPYKLAPVSEVVPTFWTFDGSTAIELDHHGKAHIAAGRMRANCDGSARYYFPGTDGLIYWNESMVAMDTTRLSNMDSLYEHNQLVGYVAENSAGDSIVGFPFYGVGLSSYPQISIDNFGNIIILWTAVTVGDPSPDPYNYRRKWMRVWCHGFNSFSQMYDIDESVLYLFQEYVFPSMAKRITDNRLQIISQTSSQPGSNIQTTGTTNVIPVHDVNMEYREFDYAYMFCPVGINDDKYTSLTSVGQLYPAPAHKSINLDIVLHEQNQISFQIFTLTGETLMAGSNGIFNIGSHRIQVDCSTLQEGFYIFTLKTNQQSFSRKLIVRHN
jgi:hypothetical protein